MMLKKYIGRMDGQLPEAHWQNGWVCYWKKVTSVEWCSRQKSDIGGMVVMDKCDIDVQVYLIFVVVGSS